MNPPRIMSIAALVVLAGIIVGALGSHALRTALDADQRHALETAVQYQLVNGLGLFLIGLLARSQQDAWMRRIALLLLAGVLCFSGGIYIMLAGAPRALGLVTPLGGVLMISAWALLAWRLHKISVMPRG
ncbi:MAG TPA: DUF423 domain-containing protein [Steroidobacteraceae bacterium]|nr:DUF423 domain-containing protein [Steroidobacteraceae bacterium]